MKKKKKNRIPLQVTWWRRDQDPVSHKQVSFAICTYATPRGAKLALEMLSDLTLGGGSITVTCQEKDKEYIPKWVDEQRALWRRTNESKNIIIPKWVDEQRALWRRTNESKNIIIPKWVDEQRAMWRRTNESKNIIIPKWVDEQRAMWRRTNESEESSLM
jgi:hypothetical protein